ncbi:PAS domain-containing protein [Ensifer soli]|uniref:PAS domain-containing protein n=1 Tax=Ciceribacter sp. sgz301302 TaxID=3342379 RepID=UPI0035BB4ED5
MNDVASAGANIQKVLLEVLGEALGAVLVVCDRHDEIIFISRQILQFFPVPVHVLQPGTRLKDFLGAVYDCGLRAGTVPEASRRRSNRDEWISDHLSLHWRERHETVERLARQRWIAITKRRLSSGYGLMAIRDVTESKKREELFQADLERVALTESILDNLPNPVCVKDRNLSYVAVNRAFCALHGLSPEAFIGRSVWDVVEPELAEKFERSDRVVLETGAPFSLPEQIVRADGEDLWVVTRKFRIGVPGKYFIVTCMNDVSDIASAGEVPAADDTPADGLRIVHYDAFEPGQNCYDPFRGTEVQAIAGAASMLAPSPSRGRVLVHTADAATEAFILPLLSGWGFEACAVRSLAEQRDFFALAAEVGIGIDLLLVDRTAPESLRAVGLHRDVTAVAFDPACDPARLEDDMHRALVAGAEPAEAVLPDWHGLPADEIPQAERIDVLVAEDNQINQFVFSQILEGLGLSFRIAANGAEAVELWQAHRPELVLMDVAMPVLSGPDAALVIRRAEAGHGPRTPIVAVLAQALDLDEERYRAAGMDGHIMKPISPDMIEDVYHRFVPGKAARRQQH